MIDRNVTVFLGSIPRATKIFVSQFDTMWRFVFTIIHNSQPWQIPTGATAVLNGRKPDGNVFAFSGTIANNKVTVDCDVQMTAVAGKTDCELSILADGKVIGTANFVLDVEAAPKSPDDVSSESTLPAYGELLSIVSGDIESAVNKWLNAHSSQIGGLSNEAKAALLALLEKVAYVDENGQTYLDTLHDALYPPASLVSISAVFEQGSAVIYDTDSLDTLKQYLTVTASFDDGSTQTVNNYTLSGTLTEGTSTITASYGGKTTTFSVVVTEKYDSLSYIQSDGGSYIDTGIVHTINTKAILDYMSLKESGAAFQCPLGSSGIDSNADQNPFYFFIGSSNNVDGSIGGASTIQDKNGTRFSYYDTNITSAIINYGDRKVYTLDSVNKKFYIDSTQYNVGSDVNASWGNTSIALFARKHPTEIKGYATGRIYSVKFYENEVLIADFVPKKRNSDNAYGLYDIISGTFLTNSGTGTITGA